MTSSRKGGAVPVPVVVGSTNDILSGSSVTFSTKEHGAVAVVVGSTNDILSCSSVTSSTKEHGAVPVAVVVGSTVKPETMKMNGYHNKLFSFWDSG